MFTATHPMPGTVPLDARLLVQQITDAVVKAWHGHYGGSRVEVPISVVAALALLPQRHGDDHDLAGLLLRLDHGTFVEVLRRTVLEFSVLRPDLRPRTMGLWSWLDDDVDDHVSRAVHATAHAALRAGQLQLTGDPRSARSADLLGAVVQHLRSRRSLERLGQFLTPLPVAELAGEMNMADLSPEATGRRRSVMDPCAGTGTMLLGMANAYRRHGHDPAELEWWANDIDWVAAACCAVNLHIWGFGLRVVVGCGDGLLSTWTHDALTHRQAAIDELAALWQRAKSLAVLRAVLGLAPEPDPLMGRLRAHLPAPPKAAPPHSSTFDAEAAYQQNPLF